VPVSKGWKIWQGKKIVYRITKILRDRTHTSCCGGPGLNVSAETSCPEWGSSWLSSVHPGICFSRLLSFLLSKIIIHNHLPM